MSRAMFAMMVSFVIVNGKQAYSNIGKGRLKAFRRPLGVTSNNIYCVFNQLPKVLHWLMSPLSKPRLSHAMRCSDEPCVKLSGTT